MPTPTTLLAFALASLALIAVPGPSVVFILTTTLSHGRRSGVAATLGVETGYLAHVAGTVLGISALIAASATAFTVVKVAGAGYLLVLAVRAWRAPDGGPLPGPEDRGAPLSARAAFLRALPVGVLNPKTAIFFLAFLPQFVRPDAGPVAVQLLVLGSLFIVLAAGVDVQWALWGTGLRRVVPRLSSRVLGRVSAGVLAVLAVVTLRAGRAAAG